MSRFDQNILTPVCTSIKEYAARNAFYIDGSYYTYRQFAERISAIRGVYVLRHHDEALSVIYLYFTQEQRDLVFASIVDYVITNIPICVSVKNKELRDYIQNKLHYQKLEEENISFSLPKEVILPESYILQYGDGDSFM